MRSKSRNGWSEVKFQRIVEVFERFVLCLSLTRNINLYALSHEPFILFARCWR